MIQEFPRQLEFPGKMRRQRLHAESFRRVMAAVKDVQSQFFRHRKSPLRPFAGDERVHAFIGGNFQIAARAAGDDADALANLIPPGIIFGFAPVARSSRFASSAREIWFVI